VIALDGPGADLAQRVRNLALASNPDARVEIAGDRPGGDPGTADVCVYLGADLGGAGAQDSPTVVAGDGGDALALRFEVGMRASSARPPSVLVLLDETQASDHATQRIAVGLLDGLCLGLAATDPAVLP
jgi:hypothetical protein